VLRNLGVGMRALLKPVESRDPPLFELGAGEVSRKPAGHQLKISAQSYTEINNLPALGFSGIRP